MSIIREQKRDRKSSPFVLSLYEILLIPHKEGIYSPDLAPVVGISADILLIDSVDLVNVEELCCIVAVELSSYISVIVLVSQPDADRHDEAQLLAECYLLRKHFGCGSSEGYLVLLLIDLEA